MPTPQRIDHVCSQNAWGSNLSDFMQCIFYRTVCIKRQVEGRQNQQRAIESMCTVHNKHRWAMRNNFVTYFLYLLRWDATVGSSL